VRASLVLFFFFKLIIVLVCVHRSCESNLPISYESTGRLTLMISKAHLGHFFVFALMYMVVKSWSFDLLFQLRTYPRNSQHSSFVIIVVTSLT
jgi:hypothetical protein